MEREEIISSGDEDFSLSYVGWLFFRALSSVTRRKYSPIENLKFKYESKVQKDYHLRTGTN